LIVTQNFIPSLYTKKLAVDFTAWKTTLLEWLSYVMEP